MKTTTTTRSVELWCFFLSFPFSFFSFYTVVLVSSTAAAAAAKLVITRCYTPPKFRGVSMDDGGRPSTSLPPPLGARGRPRAAYSLTIPFIKRGISFHLFFSFLLLGSLSSSPKPKPILRRIFIKDPAVYET
ncbi:hypothetical protein LZ30DRAFT_375402 [Colletotrichum cereale]|nr:hypothetical protein LZ30DRAFT_375402 [Colletotrichum cereale]